MVASILASGGAGKLSRVRNAVRIIRSKQGIRYSSSSTSTNSSRPGGPVVSVAPPLSKMMGHLVRSVDSIPLLTMLSAAASMLTGYIIYQFAVRPDFKALRTKSNAQPNIDKPIGYHSNRIFWIGKRSDHTPEEVKDLIKSMREK